MENGLLKKWLKKLKLNESAISMVLGAFVLLVVGALIFNYFQGVNQPEEEVIAEPTQKIGEVPVVKQEGKFFPEALPTTHRVKKNDNLWQIAKDYYGSGYNWVDIANANNLDNPNFLAVGQELEIPKAAVIQVEEMTPFGPAITANEYEVQEGDHLWGIAVRAYGDGFRWPEIVRENQIANPNLINPGIVLTLPR